VSSMLVELAAIASELADNITACGLKRSDFKLCQG
jgi:hypothetical protein